MVWSRLVVGLGLGLGVRLGLGVGLGLGLQLGLGGNLASLLGVHPDHKQKVI